MVHRIRQFYRNILYGLKPMDEAFIGKYLSMKEQEIFSRLKKSEQYHSILVAKGVEEEAAKLGMKIQDDLVKMGLFHDLGKAVRPTNIIEKSMAVLLKKILREKLKRIDRVGFISSYLYHGERGEEILRREKTFDRSPFLYQVVRYHHDNLEKLKRNPSLDGDFFKSLEILKKYDDLN